MIPHRAGEPDAAAWDTGEEVGRHADPAVAGSAAGHDRRARRRSASPRCGWPGGGTGATDHGYQPANEDVPGVRWPKSHRCGRPARRVRRVADRTTRARCPRRPRRRLRLRRTATSTHRWRRSWSGRPRRRVVRGRDRRSSRCSSPRSRSAATNCVRPHSPREARARSARAASRRRRGSRRVCTMSVRIQAESTRKFAMQAVEQLAGEEGRELTTTALAQMQPGYQWIAGDQASTTSTMISFDDSQGVVDRRGEHVRVAKSARSAGSQPPTARRT